jgi:hypothetical protein
MRTWVKVTIGGAIIAVAGFLALAGTGAYFAFRHMETRPSTEADAKREIDAVRTRFQGRQPLLELINPKAGDIRVNRLAHPEGRRSETVFIVSWDPDDGSRMRMDLPIWLMRFSSVNILSRLGIAPSKYRLTVDDLQRYGPGIVLDYRQPQGQHVLIWME